MKWFTADLHLSHDRIIKLAKRPFVDSEQMNNSIITNMKNNLSRGDELYILGDLSFDIYASRLFFDLCRDRGYQVHYILGNHDKKGGRHNPIYKNCITVSEVKDIKIEDQKITLCHYPMRSWNNSHHGAWQLYGHEHGSVEDIGKQYDVGVDGNDFKPLNFNQIKNIMDKKEIVDIHHREI